MQRQWLAELTLPLTEASAATALRTALQVGALNLPLPGSGSTLTRWCDLAEFAATDLVLGRLAEGHADAKAILADLAPPGAEHGFGLWGVWAAEPPNALVEAEPAGKGWILTGRKAWCSGASFLDFALITAHAPDGRRLFAVDLQHVVPVAGTWSAVGMAASGSVSVDLARVPAAAVGPPMAYLHRPGFWHGGAGVAACWYGGALGAARTLLAAVRAGAGDPHALAHLGAVDAIIASLRAHLAAAAAEIDADPQGPARLLAARLRARVEAGATEILDRVGRALGAGPLCLDPVMAQRAADLPVYLRQSHAERDLADLGALAAAEAAW